MEIQMSRRSFIIRIFERQICQENIFNIYNSKIILLLLLNYYHYY